MSMQERRARAADLTKVRDALSLEPSDHSISAVNTLGPRRTRLTSWHELLDEFRALGGTADNIRLGDGQFGRGLFPVDGTKPVAIHIPDSLLVPVTDLVVASGV